MHHTAIKKRVTMDHDTINQLREEDLDDVTTKVTMDYIQDQNSARSNANSILSLGDFRQKAKVALGTYIVSSFANSPNNELLIGSEIFKVKPNHQLDFIQTKMNQRPQVQYQNCLRFWDQDGPVLLKQWIADGKIDFENYHKLLKQNHKASGMEKYTGQVNASGLKHGFGRECWVSGQIYEGMFQNGKYHGYGRQIDYNFVYTGEFSEGERTGKGQRIWLTGKQDSGSHDYYQKPFFDKFNRKMTRDQYVDYIDKRDKESRMLRKKTLSLMAMDNNELWN